MSLTRTWGVFLTQKSPELFRPLLPRGPLQIPERRGGSIFIWRDSGALQRLAVPFNESHYIRIYYVSGWFRSVSEFINMLND